MRNGQTLILATVSQQLMLEYGKVFRNPRIDKNGKSKQLFPNLETFIIFAKKSQDD